MLVSKNALALIDVVAVEDKSRRKRTPELAQVFHGASATFIAVNFESAFASDSNLDVVACFQFKRLDDSGGRGHGLTVSPLPNLHRHPFGIQLFCIFQKVRCESEGLALVVQS